MRKRNEACRPAKVPGTHLALALMGLLAALAALVFMTDPLLPVGLKAAILALAAFAAAFILLAPARLDYRVTPSRLEIRTFAGRRALRKGQIQNVRKVTYRLGSKGAGTNQPGYYVGRFKSDLGTVRAFTSAARGDGVLLELTSGEKLLINPRDPERCLAPLGIELEEATP